MTNLLNLTDWKNCLSPAHGVIPFSIIISLFFLGQAHAQVRLSSEEADKLVIENQSPYTQQLLKRRGRKV